MSDYHTSLRPPHSPSGRSTSPVGNMNPSRYSVGKTSAGAGLMKSPNMGNNVLPSPNSRGLRPSSELVGMQHQGTPESDAIDKWFEDLQHYEATLEEMAAASLDQNFKEELSAIEQWFRVLSEAERTAALYSLLQESTQVQIRFFITVLQQMARSDPMSALLSPSHPNSIMAEQMEAKMASLGLKSPSAAASSPGARSFRQSSDATGFLSPNAAALYGGNNDAAAMLAAQRAKLKANRISAPGTLAGDHNNRNFSGGNLDQVQESRSPNMESSSNSMRPKSTDGLASAASKSPRPSGPLDDTLSPITHNGNWASMVNTPLVPMFGDDTANGQALLDATAAQLASVGQDGRGILLDQDVSKYRRKSGIPPGGGLSSPMASPNLAAAGANSSPGLWNASQNDFLRQAMAQSTTSPLPGSANSGSFNLQMSPNSLAGLQSPSGGLSNPMNMQMMNSMAAMGGLGNMSAAQFLTMQQQILQNQQQIAALAAGNFQSPSNNMMNTSQFRQQQQPMSSGNRSGGMSGAAFQHNLSPNIGGMMPTTAGRRSPASNSKLPLPPRSSGGQQSATSAGHGEEDVTDLKLLQDIPNWLRVLRLHKYTPNFEHIDWKEIVVMSDKDLEVKGVAALGARRKMLKTFESVREKHGIPHPEGSMPIDVGEKPEGAGDSIQAGFEA
ncbi:hypothetical protein CBS101457_001440 [Exobasidium rhododendri]|nr:hypothetical protein CBS101457_001440 [Exobasidium rhododendri]